MIPPLLHIIFSSLLVMLWDGSLTSRLGEILSSFFGERVVMGAGLRFDCWVEIFLAVLHCATFMTAFKSPSIASWLEL